MEKAIIRKLLLTALIVMTCAGSGLAQERLTQKKNELTIRYGMVHGVVKDQMYSPLNYSSTGGTLGLKYTRNTKRSNILTVSIDLKTNEVETDVSDAFLADQIQWSAEIAFLKKLSDRSMKWNFFIGGDIHARSSFIKYEDPLTLSSSLVYVSHRGLGLQALTERYFRRNTVSAIFKLPVAGSVFRTPYSGYSEDLDDAGLSFMFTHGQFGSLHNYFAPTLRLSATNHTLRWLDITAGYELNYLKSNIRKSITEMQGHFVLSTTIKF